MCRKLFQLVLMGACFFLTWHPQLILANIIPYQATEKTIHLKDYAEYLVDVNNEWTFRTIINEKSQDFRPLEGQDLNQGFTNHSYWFRFKFSDIPDLTTPLVLLPGYALIDHIILFIPTSDGSYQAKVSGRNYPANKRELKNRSPGFVFQPQSFMSDQYFYIKARTSSSSQFPFELIRLLDYSNRDHDAQYANALYVGAMLIMAIYNLIFFIMTRQLRYGIYVVFVISSGLLCMAIYGYTFEYLWPNAVRFNKISINLIGNMAALSVSLFYIFSLRVLHSKALFLNITYGFVFLAILSSILGIFLPYALGVQLMMLGLAANAAYLIFVAAYFTLKGNRTAFFYLLSFVALFLGTIVYIFQIMGQFPSNIVVELGPQIGSALQVTLLTFALADQFRELKIEKEAAQAKLLAVQEEHIRTLDEKVEEKTRDIKSILSSIQQGIFTVSGDNGVIDPEFSEHLKEILHTNDIAGKNPIDLLFKNSNLTKEVISQIETVLISTLNESEFTFAANSGLLVHDFEKMYQGTRQFFQLDWNPVIDEESIVRKILITVRDVTKLKSLEQQSQEQTKELEIIKEILGNPPEKLARFTSKAKQFIAISLKAISKDIDSRSLHQIFIMMHTLKGDARALGLSMASQQIHELEELIHRAQSAPHQFYSQLQDALEKLLILINDFEHVENEKLGRRKNENSRMISGERLTEILQTFKKVSEHDIQADSRLYFLKTKKMIYSACYETLTEILEDIAKSAATTAKYLGKESPELIYKFEEETFIKKEARDALTNSFIHIFRNSLDHGIEFPSERQSVGKPSRGQILITSSFSQGWLTINYQDDGKGLNLPYILEKAQSRDLVIKPGSNLPDIEIAQLIFSPGFSTAEEITEVSGRGVGMSAAKSFIEDIGGSLQIELLEYQDRKSVPFRIKVMLPLSCLEAAA